MIVQNSATAREQEGESGLLHDQHLETMTGTVVEHVFRWNVLRRGLTVDINSPIRRGIRRFGELDSNGFTKLVVLAGHYLQSRTELCFCQGEDPGRISTSSVQKDQQRFWLCQVFEIN